MPLLQPTRDLLGFLQRNPAIRSQIRAAPNQTLLYAGNFFRPMWQDLADLKRRNPQFAAKEILPDVLIRIRVQGQRHLNLLDWAKALDILQPWNENGFIAWRALSGIFASNAIGTVSFFIGSGVTRDDKVFAATEISVLARNPNIDAITRDALAYYQRCLQTKQANMNFGFIAG
jgi:hypothetical protein